MAALYYDAPNAPTARDENRAVGARKREKTPLGKRIWKCVMGIGDQVGELLRLAERDGSDATHRWIRQFTQACTERYMATAQLMPSARRHLEDPTARDIAAVWMMLVEHEHHGMVNSRSLWHGHKKAGKAGGMGGRLRGKCAEHVRQCLDVLEASGLLKRWQAQPNTPGVVKSEDGQCYQSYLLFHVPGAIRRLVRAHRVKHKQRATTPPDALPSVPTRWAPPERWNESDAEDARQARATLARMLAEARDGPPPQAPPNG